MSKDESDKVVVRLVQAADGHVWPAVEMDGKAVTTATPIPFSTPGPAVEEAWGDRYVGCAFATLTGAAFEIDPSTQSCIPLEDLPHRWDWSIYPKYSGKHALNAQVRSSGSRWTRAEWIGHARWPFGERIWRSASSSGG